MPPRFNYVGVRVRDMEPTRGKVVGLRSPGSAQLLELNRKGVEVPVRPREIGG